MTYAKVLPIEPTPGTLIEAAYTTPDYVDAYKITTTGAPRIEDFATGFFLSQPGWLAKVSMNLGDATSRLESIGAGDYLEGSSVGSWRVHGRNDDEIMFGEHMGFMEYRFSVLRLPDGDVQASTSVKYLKRFAPFYFGVVKPFHVGFIKVALGNAAKHAAAPAAQR